MDRKYKLRLTSYLYKTIKKLHIDTLTDPRNSRGKRWSLITIIHAVLYGILSGQKSLHQVEQMTEELSPSMRRLLGIRKRIADTTLRDFLVKIDATVVESLLYRCIHQAIRKKALVRTNHYPFHVVAMDGKVVVTKLKDPTITQTHHDACNKEHYELKTITSCLISTPSKPCIGASLVPPATNEKGYFVEAFSQMLQVYGNSFFKLITYDAGANSLENASYVHKSGYYYLFSLKSDQRTLYRQAVQKLGCLDEQTCVNTTEEKKDGKIITRRLWINQDIGCQTKLEQLTKVKQKGWSHLKLVTRRQTEVLHISSGEITNEDHYFITNMGKTVLDAGQLQMVIRDHWGVENNCHCTWDKAFEEDKHHFIEEPKGTLAVLLLRRSAYTILTLFRSVTQRSAKQKGTPWKVLIRRVLYLLHVFDKSWVPRQYRLSEALSTA